MQRREIIPAELRDLIIDQFHADRPSLKASSLTCKAWLPRARYHLFRIIKLTPGANGDAFRQLLATTPELGKYMQEVEVCGLTSGSRWTGALPNPHLGPLQFPTRTPQRPNSKQNDSDATEIVAWLDRVLPKSNKIVTRVWSLTLTSMPISHKIAEALSPHFGKVTKLVFNGCQGLAFNDYVELRRFFVHVTTIAMLDARWLPHVGIPRGIAGDSSRTKVHTLELSRKIDVVTLIGWFKLHARYKAIRSLSCFISGHQPACSLKEMFEGMGEGLEYLSIGFAEVRDPTDVLRSSDFSLGACTGLRELKIVCSTGDQFATYKPSLSWTLTLLSAVSSVYFSALSFSIPNKDALSFNYDALKIVLQRDRFKAVKKLSFEIEIGKFEKSDTTVLEKKIWDRMLPLEGIYLDVYFIRP